MRVFKWMFVMAIVAALAACNGEQSADDTADDMKEETEAVYEESREGAEDAADASSEAVEDAKESDAWQATKDRADKAWTATKEYSLEAWETVRESFRGDMTAEDKQKFDECVVRLQKVEGLTEKQAERGCWRMMEEGTREDYYAEKGGSEFWANVKEGTSDAWESTKEGSKEAWEATKEGSRNAWAATKEYSREAWDKTRESFKGDMTAEDKQAFDDCADKLRKEEGLTEKQAERGCWRMMEEETLNDYLAEGESAESGE